MEMARLSYTSVADYLAMPLRDVLDLRAALVNVLERERDARKNA